MVVCPDCGKDVKDAKFCSNCGAVLSKAQEIKEPVEEVDAMEVDESVVDEVVPEVIEDEENIEVNVASEEPAGEVIEVNIKKSKFCPNCGAEITKKIAFCPQCGFKLEQDDEPQTKFCQTCGKKININAEICPYCGVRVAGVVPSEEKNVLLAAILSFLFPGLGHLYNGLTKKGVSFIIAYIVSAVLVILVIGFVLMLIVWIWALIDAIKTTEAINRGEVVEDKLF